MFSYCWQRLSSSLLLPALVSAHTSFCQTSAANYFIKHGNNLSQVSCGGILFAPFQNQNHQAYGAGSVWLKQQVDLSQPYTISFIVDFADTTAVDGGAFVFVDDTAAVGDTYNGLGFRNLKKSLGITIDAKRTNADNDPPFDHLSIQKNGDTKHGTANELVTPISIEPYYVSQIYNNAFHHLVTVNWDPVTTKIEVQIDHNTVLQTQYDMVQNIFGGNPLVYAGFTASNTQEQYYPPPTELTFGNFYFFFGDVLPKFTSQPNLDTCFSRPIQFFDASTYALDTAYNNVRAAKWYWSFGDGQTSDLRFPPPHQFPNAGEYTLKFTVSNSIGCTFDTLIKTIHLGAVPIADFTIEGAACANSPMTFKDLSTSTFGEVTAWTWTLPGGISSIEHNPTENLPTAGFATINLRVRTYYGCEAEKTKTIEIGEKPLLDFTYSKDCDGNVTFTPVQLNGANIVRWTWTFGDGSLSISPQTSHHYKWNQVAIASLVEISNTGCVSDSVSRPISINKIYPFAGDDTIVAVGQPLQLQATGGDHYEWTPSIGLSNFAIANPIATLQQDQQYIVRVTNNDGCEAYDTIMIKVYKGPDVYLPSAFSPNHDGHNDDFKPIGPGIQSLQYFRIYNRTGMLLFQTKDINKGWDGTFDGRAQPGGTYVWMLLAVDIYGTKIFRKGTVVLLR